MQRELHELQSSPRYWKPNRAGGADLGRKRALEKIGFTNPRSFVEKAVEGYFAASPAKLYF